MPEQEELQHSVLWFVIRSVLSVSLGIIVVLLLSYITQQLIRSVDVFQNGSPTAAIIYRSVYVILGGFVAARFSVCGPVQHALAVGIIQLVLVAISAYVLIPMQFFGPTWYYIWLGLMALPCALIGGMLHQFLSRQGS